MKDGFDYIKSELFNIDNSISLLNTDLSRAMGRQLEIHGTPVDLPYNEVAEIKSKLRQLKIDREYLINLPYAYKK